MSKSASYEEISDKSTPYLPGLGDEDCSVVRALGAV
jgi:hypothetical protein